MLMIKQEKQEYKEEYGNTNRHHCQHRQHQDEEVAVPVAANIEVQQVPQRSRIRSSLRDDDDLPFCPLEMREDTMPSP
ncbi:hypothetical protein cyc_02303 [Cyclospora cayetanensis]|uniref:Uncharacterized protein n=1 Tax=Cyclospora cayetanensis TaxID=88456 RepID=A0A1D3D5G4_9EIME|nr:hypothetical protein cyc_02303 [Cyclospora cayetanensis]